MSLIKSADSLCLVSLLCDNDFSFLLQGIIMYSVKGGSWEFSLNQLFNQLCPKGIPRILNRYFWFLFFVFFLIFLFLGPQRISVCSGGLLSKSNSWCLQNMFILFSPHRCLIVLHGSPLSHSCSPRNRWRLKTLLDEVNSDFPLTLFPNTLWIQNSHCW